LSSHPLVVERMAAAVRDLGCGSTGSRLLRGERDAFTALEQRFAKFKGAQAALYFSSGYLANLAVITTFAEPGDAIYSDQLNHASLIDGVRLAKVRRVVFPHVDVPRIEELMQSDRACPKFVVTESLFSMDGDRAPLAELAGACERAEAALMVDEAHAAGVYGERGSGLIEETGVARQVFLSINPAGKALGVAGAFVAGPSWAIEYLAQRARPFVFSTAPPPAVAAALEASLDIIEDEPERRARLRTLACSLRDRLASAGIAVCPGDSPIIPVVLGDNARAVAAAARLQQDGFDVRAIRPPSVPAGAARLRITVNVNLTEQILDRFVERLCAACS
jgi:8-amino-7-oxononanoate synthase